MAAGGSVVHPAVPAILVTPICPHVLSFRSMVFPDHVVLRCYVPNDARSDAYVAFDGKHRRELHRGDSVQIQMSVHPGTYRLIFMCHNQKTFDIKCDMMIIIILNFIMHSCFESLFVFRFIQKKNDSPYHQSNRPFIRLVK